MKLLELLGIYHEKGCVLIFVERQESADLLLRDLLKASYPCLALHGGIDQYDRDSIIQVMKNKRQEKIIPVLHDKVSNVLQIISSGESCLKIIIQRLILVALIVT